jgi:HTH-type transcriptional repressor of NAD biosynthesis genes
VTRFNSAVVFGKFWPLHIGHTRLIRAAEAEADRVLVIVNDGDEDVPANVRVEWVAEAFPEVTVALAPDLCGHDTDKCTPECSERYASWLVKEHGHVDVVVSGEPYGDLLASNLRAHSLRLDRSQLPVAGRDIRADVAAHWDLLSESSRAWYCRRVVIVGAESTGTTTLASDLALRLGTECVPEYGREFTENHGINHAWRSQDFELIALRQIDMEIAAARRSGPILICDTDSLATSVWHERYIGSRSPRIEAMAAQRLPHLYVLTSDDLPFVQDGMRDGEHLRGWMTTRFREILRQSSVPWIEAIGKRNERQEIVLDAMRLLLGSNWVAGEVNRGPRTRPEGQGDTTQQV